MNIQQNQMFLMEISLFIKTKVALLEWQQMILTVLIIQILDYGNIKSMLKWIKPQNLG